MLQEERRKFLLIVWLQSKRKMKNFKNRMESVETEMMKIKDLVFQQFNTRPPSTACDGHETRGSNLISIFILFFENWFGLNVGRYLDGVYH